jgi:hypothetical protein
MVTIIDYKLCKSATGNEFFGLVLQGDVEIVTSQETGRAYATARKALMSSTFSEVVCQSLIGKQLPGSIEKIKCDPYEYTVPETGEVIELSHTYEYFQEGVTHQANGHSQKAKEMVF